MEQMSFPSLVGDRRMRELLRQVVAGFAADPALQEDLMQEALLHLWKVERERPGRTRSWYLQSCRFRLQHWLALGRSLDSPKRANGGNRITIEGADEEPALSDYHTNGELFASVCFQDFVLTLASHLQPREQGVLVGLADGLTLREIASNLKVSYPTALKSRRRIAGVTLKLGMAFPLPE